MTLAELLKAANVKDEVIAGLPPEVTAAVTGFVADADNKIQTATQKESDAAEKLRLAEAERSEINEYVEKYGSSLTDAAGLRAQLEAQNAYLTSLKAQGFDVKVPDAAPVVPGSPAKGGNAFDPETFKAQVGGVMAQFLNANNEHIRLTGQPLPDDAEVIASAARAARQTIGEYVAAKYKFSEIRAAKQKDDFDKRLAAERKAGADEATRKLAEANGGNPNLVAGQASRNSFVPKIKSEEFHSRDGNKPRGERLRNMLDSIHKEVAASQGA